MLWKTYRVKRHEVGLVFRFGELTRVLEPGKHRLFALPRKGEIDVELVNTFNPRFNHAQLDALIGFAPLREKLHVLEVSSSQRALVWVEDRLLSVHGPGRYAFWRAPQRVNIELFDATEPRFTHPRLDQILGTGGTEGWLQVVEAPEQSQTFLLVGGVVREKLTPGRHAFWRFASPVKTVSVDTREKTLDVAGQEIMTADKVTLRLNLVVTLRVLDALKAVTLCADHDAAVYREAQLALRALVGSRTLDDLLSDKEAVGGGVKSALLKRADELGIAIVSVGLKDIILPGEMKTILNQVIEAEKRAQAELIKRREETAAARSQANTARLLAENPLLARLKELEALQQILAGTKATFVLGPGEIAQQIRSLVVTKPESTSG